MEKWLFVGVEVDGDDGGYVYGVAVEDVGTVAPALDGGGGGAAEEAVSAEDAGGDDLAFGGDDGLEDDLATDVGEAGHHGVAGLGRLEEVGGHDAG